MTDDTNARPGERFIRKPELRHRTGWSNSTIDRAVASGRCPKPVRIGPRAVAWVESEIDALIARIIREGVQ